MAFHLTTQEGGKTTPFTVRDFLRDPQNHGSVSSGREAALVFGVTESTGGNQSGAVLSTENWLVSTIV